MERQVDPRTKYSRAARRRHGSAMHKYLDLFITRKQTWQKNHRVSGVLSERTNASFERVHSAALAKNFIGQVTLSGDAGAAINFGVVWLGELAAAVLLEMLGRSWFTRVKLGGRSGLHIFQTLPTRSYHTELSGPNCCDCTEDFSLVLP